MKKLQQKKKKIKIQHHKKTPSTLLFNELSKIAKKPSSSPTAQLSKASSLNASLSSFNLKSKTAKQSRNSSKPKKNEIVSQSFKSSFIPNSFDLKQFAKKVKQPLQQQATSNTLTNIISKKSFKYQYVVGRGGFGKVWKVRLQKTKKVYALKQMHKSLQITIIRILAKNSIQSVLNQKALLCNLKNSFIVNMHCSFQDKQMLYLAMDYMPGGDLRYHIGRYRCFTQKQTSKQNQSEFFICSIINGLEYLHSNNIIHRDIKPQNLVLDQDGYVRITDLGIARIVKKQNSNDTSGTPGYMSPQVMCHMNHTFTADYYALGVIAFQFMLGRRPYNGRSRQEIREQILQKQIQLKTKDLPKGWSTQTTDFINRLILRKPNYRLGSLGIGEIKAHPWIRNFDWQGLSKKIIKAPFQPSVQFINKKEDNNFDISQQITVTQEQEMMQQNNILLRKDSIQQRFANYNFEGGDWIQKGYEKKKKIKKNNFFIK